MRLVVLACVACTACQAVFHLDMVGTAGDAAPGSDAAGSGSDQPNLVFVTSQKVVAGSLGGVDAADSMCSSLAAAAGHPGRYVAWLSSSTSSVTSRIGTTARGWVRADGRPFADTLVDIVQGRVWYPLRLTEAGDDVVASGQAADLTVATGTDATGIASIDTCSDYTDTSRGVTSGLADRAPYGWSSDMGGFCSEPTRLYCFGIDHVSPVTLVPESSRSVFVSVNDLTSGAALSAYDQECQSEAATAGLTGTYRAAMATTSASALSRFTPGAPWVRSDGVTAIDSSGKIIAPIEFEPHGGFEITIAWSGAPSLTATAPASTASCSNWSVMDATQGLTGNVSRSSGDGFGGIANTCNNAFRVYCLQD